jgi:hypothetical protein
MTDHFDFMTQRLELFFDPRRVIGQKARLVVNQDIDLHSLSNSVFDEVKKWDILGRSFEQELRRDHPARHINGLFGIFDWCRKRIKVVFTINIKLRVSVLSGWSKTVKPVDVEVRRLNSFLFQQVQEDNIVLDALGFEKKTAMVGNENDTKL